MLELDPPRATDTEPEPQYAPAVEAPRDAAAPRSDHGWVWQVTALSGVMGIMLALAITSTERLRSAGLPGNRLGLSAAFEGVYREQNARLENEIRDLRAEVDGYVSNMDDSSRATERLKKEFEQLKNEAGLSPVAGPGLRITLRDNTEGGVADFATNMVHDQDLVNLLNELKAAGARSIAISGADTDRLQRVIVTTTARCVGPTAIVNNTPLAAPYAIQVVGDPKELRSWLERPEGYIRARELDARQMITLEEVSRLALPEYAGTLTARYARPLAEKPKTP